MKRTSILGPLLLTAAGTTLLFVQLLQTPVTTVLLWVSHWWPAVLIGAGLVWLGEWALDARADQASGTLLPRRRLGVGAAFALVLVALLGLLGSNLAGMGSLLESWNPAGSGPFWNVEQFLGRQEDSERSLSAALPADGRLRIENRHGNVSVSGTSSDGQVHVVAHQHLWAWHDAELREKQTKSAPVFEAASDGLQLRAGGEGQDETDFAVTLPRHAEVEIADGTGEITVSSLEGPLTVDTHRGPIHLASLGGRVHVTLHDKNTSLVAHDLSGDMDVQGRGGDLSLFDVRGSVRLEGDFYGTTHLARVNGPVHFQSSRSTFECALLPGELTIRGREIFEARDVRGPVVVSTSDRKVEVNEAQGAVRITNRTGEVTLGLEGPPQPVEVSTTKGDIHLRAGAFKGLTVDAETADGSIENDLGVSARTDGDRSRLRIDGKPGAPALTLNTNEGDIDIRSVSAEQGVSAVQSHL